MTIVTINRANVESLSSRDIVHYTGESGKHPRGNRCHQTIGPRGGVTTSIVECRISGMVKLWKTRPNEFRVPVKHGMYDNGSISENNGTCFHRAQDCVLEVYCQACGWTTNGDAGRRKHGEITPCKFAPAQSQEELLDEIASIGALPEEMRQRREKLRSQHDFRVDKYGPEMADAMDAAKYSGNGGNS